LSLFSFALSTVDSVPHVLYAGLWKGMDITREKHRERVTTSGFPCFLSPLFLNKDHPLCFQTSLSMIFHPPGSDSRGPLHACPPPLKRKTFCNPPIYLLVRFGVCGPASARTFSSVSPLERSLSRQHLCRSFSHTTRPFPFLPRKTPTPLPLMVSSSGSPLSYLSV